MSDPATVVTERTFGSPVGSQAIRTTARTPRVGVYKQMSRPVETSNSDYSSTTEEVFTLPVNDGEKEIRALTYNSDIRKFFLMYKSDPSDEITRRKAQKLLHRSVFHLCINLNGETLTPDKALAWGVLDKSPSSKDKEAFALYDVNFVAFFETDASAPGENIKGMLAKEHERENPFPVQMCTMRGEEGKIGSADENTVKLVNECIREPGVWKSVKMFGRRLHARSFRSSKLLKPAMPLMFKSPSSGCVEIAAANCIFERDEEAARKLVSAVGKENFKRIRSFAPFLQKHVRTWAVKNPRTTDPEIKKQRHWGSKQKAEWLLGRESGLFLAQLLARGASFFHCIGFDCARKVLYDPADDFSYELDRTALIAACDAKDSSFIGIGELMELVPLPRATTKRSMRSRGSRKRSRSSSAK